MSCTRNDQELFLHAHEQLSSAARLKLEMHLQSCSQCRNRWARCVAEKDSLRRALAPLPVLQGESRGLAEAVSMRIRFEPQAVPRRPGLLARGSLPLAVVAAVALTLAVAFSAVAAFLAPGPPKGGCGPSAPVVLPGGPGNPHGGAVPNGVAGPTGGCPLKQGNAPGNAPAAAGAAKGAAPAEPVTGVVMPGR